MATEVKTRIGWLVVLLVVVGAAGIATGEAQRGRGPQGPPEIVGKWSGTWSSFNPAQATAQPREVTNGEFIGFYTSAYATGFFTLTRAK